MALNKTWGQKTANFYGRNKEDDNESDTDDDEDEKEEAKRLQQIKAHKMKKFMQQQQDVVINEEGARKEMNMDDSSDSSDDEGDRKRIGDKLFSEKGNKAVLSAETIREYAKDMETPMLEKLIEKEMPELNPMLFELRSALSELNDRIKPAL